MKLVAFSAREGFSLAGLRASALSTVQVGKGYFTDWRIHVRGPAVLLESPAGFNGSPVRTIYEVPRTSLNLQWELEDGEKLSGLAEYSTPEIEPPKPVVQSPPPMPLRPKYVNGKPVAPTPPPTDDDDDGPDDDDDDPPVKRSH